MSNRPLQIWSGSGHVGGVQRTLVVAATTKKRAVELLSQVTILSIKTFNDYYSTTKNEVHLKIATEEGVWSGDINRAREAHHYLRVVM